MVTVLVPTSSDTTADQVLVPAAVPEAPVDVDQRTAVTPTLSEAVPAIVIEAVFTEMMLVPDEVIWIDGGVLSPDDGGWLGWVGCVG